MSGIIVRPYGPRPATFMLVGEAPGKNEASRGRPFVGKSGMDQADYLRRHGVNVAHARLANVVWEYFDENPDPTPTRIAQWADELRAEVLTTQPKVVVAVGRFAMRFFLGESARLDKCRGIAHRAGVFDATRANRAPADCVIVPVMHPAAGMYDGKARGPINDGYRRAAEFIRAAQRGEVVAPIADSHVGRELYRDVSGAWLRDYLLTGAERHPPALLALDTEGSAERPWSVQVTCEVGTGYLLRCSRDDFAVGAAAIAQLAAAKDAQSAPRTTILLHAALHDLAVLRACGIDLTALRAQVVDTMYMAYLTCLEPQSLKLLAWRWCGMAMPSYRDTLGRASDEMCVDYLLRVAERGTYNDQQKLGKKGQVLKSSKELNLTGWPRPAEQLIEDNDGSMRLYNPQPVAQRAEKILIDYYGHATDSSVQTDDDLSDDDAPAVGSEDLDAGDDDDDLSAPIADTDTGEDDAGAVDIAARWLAIDAGQRAMVERDPEFGPFPAATLDDVPLPVATRYACRDTDATMRIYHALMPTLEAMGTVRTLSDGMAVAPIFERIQANGMPASRQALTSLLAEVNASMYRLQSRISNLYYSGRPFNPGSSIHTATLMRIRGLDAEKRTKSGKVSTAKKSIEHLRHTDAAMSDLIDWRELAKVKFGFVVPLLRKMSAAADAPDIQFVHGQVKTTRVTSRRLAMTNPNLLQIPTRSEIGSRVRSCFVAPPGYVIGGYDLSMIEVRVGAHESSDEVLCAILREGRDVHYETAASIFKVGLDERLPLGDKNAPGWPLPGHRYAVIDRKRQRLPAKTCTFGMIYGIQGQGMYDQLRQMSPTGLTDWSAAKCDEMRVAWLAKYDGFNRYGEIVGRELAKTGWVRDHWGMPRHLPGIWAYEEKFRAEAVRLAVSHRIQGGAQGLIQRSMIWLEPELMALRDLGVDVQWRLQVHDELIFTVQEEYGDVVGELVTQALTQHGGWELSVPIEAEGHTAANWGALK